MKHLFHTLLLATLCAATSYGQTMKSLMYNTTNGNVVYSSTNVLTFTNEVRFASGDLRIDSVGGIYWSGDLRYEPETQTFYQQVQFGSSAAAAATRTNLGLGATNVVQFARVTTSFIQSATTNAYIELDDDNFIIEAAQLEVRTPINFLGTNVAATTRTNLGLGATNTPAFRGLTSDGNIVITNQSATNNGIVFIYRTNNEPFLGLANLIASNNTTISNETLFRVGVAEATNQSAQFGFRSTNTNGSGVAVFSVFGYNALMMVGADASTNAVIYSGGGTDNEVMTLIRDGATEFARPIRFSTNASTRPATNAPANTTNVVAWVEMRIGTNSYRVPLYQ
jgi:hypothetical protein